MYSKYKLIKKVELNLIYIYLFILAVLIFAILLKTY